MESVSLKAKSPKGENAVRVNGISAGKDHLWKFVFGPCVGQSITIGVRELDVLARLNGKSK